MGSLLASNQPVIWSLPFELMPRTDPGNAGAIPVNGGYFVINNTVGGVETRTLAIPTVRGVQMLLVAGAAVTAANRVTVTAGAGSFFNEGGTNVITFRNPGESVLLQAFENGAALSWRIVSSTESALWEQDPGTAPAVLNPGSLGYNLTIAAGVAETNTIAAPTSVGQEITIVANQLGALGTRAITFTGQQVREGGAAAGVFTLATEGTAARFKAAFVNDVLVWRLVWEDLGPGSSIT